jgi:hypothetical protein
MRNLTTRKYVNTCGYAGGVDGVNETKAPIVPDATVVSPRTGDIRSEIVSSIPPVTHRGPSSVRSDSRAFLCELEPVESLLAVFDNANTTYDVKLSVSSDSIASGV